MTTESDASTTSANFEDEFDHVKLEEECRDLWDREEIYHFQKGEGNVFSVDTPPPYVSAAHLHVGHAMSYAQAEFIVRYQRMKGKNIFYPMGFDDNGLPTERYVEQKFKINKSKTSRSEFRALCIEETQHGARVYEKLWRALGLSVDWNLRYTTIDEHCRRTAQLSFLDLYRKGRIYRSDEPVIWDTHFQTSLAQADVETIPRKGRIHDIRFSDPEGNPLVISTTRPELIPACVALYCHPDDDRYKALIDNNQQAVVPLFEYTVPIKTSTEVDIEFGTGLMMVCTFGDGEDVAKWKADKLETRICIGHDGKMTELAGDFAGMDVNQARSQIVKALEASGALLESKTIEQNVSVAERSQTPIEFAMAPQWFIKLLDIKDELLQRSRELEWFPEFMKVRLDDWIEGLRYDWNISRQRFYGVPFPVWYDEETGEVVLPEEDELPVDPAEQTPRGAEGRKLIPELDVMDTWMTSSLTPQINSNWAGSPSWPVAGDEGIFPMSVRVQAFEIIRTWLFYTVAKAHFHQESLPWKSVMISGWGLNEQGKKISKRDLEKHTDADGYNRYEPYAVIEKYGADALRYWAAGSHLGQDLRFQEKGVKAGRRVVVKLWNVGRLADMLLGGFRPPETEVPLAERTAEDRWVLAEIHAVAKTVEQGFEKYDYAVGREALEKFFWATYCDNYLELVKDRFWRSELHSDESRASAHATLYESLGMLLHLFAPFLPFITEAVWQRTFGRFEGSVSLHVSPWQVHSEEAIALAENNPEIELLLPILTAVRQLRSNDRIPAGRVLKSLALDLSGAKPESADMLRAMESSLLGAAKAEAIIFDGSLPDASTTIEDLGIGIVDAES